MIPLKLGPFEATVTPEQAGDIIAYMSGVEVPAPDEEPDPPSGKIRRPWEKIADATGNE